MTKSTRFGDRKAKYAFCDHRFGDRKRCFWRSKTIFWKLISAFAIATYPCVFRGNEILNCSIFGSYCTFLHIWKVEYSSRN